MELKAATVAELLALSPAEKLEAAEWLRREALKASGDQEEGSTVGQASAVLEGLRGLDKAARRLVLNQIRAEELLSK